MPLAARAASGRKLPGGLSTDGEMHLTESRCGSSKIRFTWGRFVPEEGGINEPEKHILNRRERRKRRSEGVSQDLYLFVRMGPQPFQGCDFSAVFSQGSWVARPSQRWALLRNPFGILPFWLVSAGC